MLLRVALVRTDVSEELSTSFIRVTGIGELGTTLAVTSNRRTLRRSASNRRTLRRNTSNRRTLRRNTTVFLRSVRRLLVRASVVPSSPIQVTLMKEALRSYETSVLTRVARRNIQEAVILQRNNALHSQGGRTSKGKL
jgi:hypothetical protein